MFNKHIYPGGSGGIPNTRTQPNLKINSPLGRAGLSHTPLHGQRIHTVQRSRDLNYSHPLHQPWSRPSRRCSSLVVLGCGTCGSRQRPFLSQWCRPITAILHPVRTERVASFH